MKSASKTRFHHVLRVTSDHTSVSNLLLWRIPGRIFFPSTMITLVVCIGLVSLAAVSRFAFGRSLLGFACYSAGISLYAFLQYAYKHRTDFVVALGVAEGPQRDGFLFASVVVPVLLLSIALVPFVPRQRAEFHRLTRTTLPHPTMCLSVWMCGSLLYHILCVTPLWGVDHPVWSSDVLPLGLYSCILLLAFIADSLARLGGLRFAARDERVSAAHLRTSDPLSRHQPNEETERLRERLTRLKDEAEAAERRWAAAVLQERAARVQAERFAQEFAQARKSMGAQAGREDDKPRTVEDALRILRLVPGCTPEQAKGAYRKMMMQYHPDKVSIMGSAIRETAERETKRINEAYRIISRSFERTPSGPKS